MDNNIRTHVSVEKFAAFLDGNLDEHEMNEMDRYIAGDPMMSEIMSMSDIVDEAVLQYTNDEFAYETDMELLDNSDFEIPNLDDGFVESSDYSYLEHREALADAIACENIDSIGNLGENEDIFMDDSIYHYNIGNDDFLDSNHHTIDENFFDEQ